MNDLVATCAITNLSALQVSDMAKELDVLVDNFRTRPLDTGPYLYVSCDVLTMKVREGGRAVKTSHLMATGVNADGYRELLGMQVATAESAALWTEFFRDLKAPPTPAWIRCTWSPVTLTRVPRPLWVTACHWPAGSGAAPTLRRTCHQWCRKPKWPPLSAMFQTIFQQPGADSVRRRARDLDVFG